ncbi:hypothetical protein ACFXHA_45225 [Nocardia sp. NPDC059240]|uniref:hypothetical protein n=1 Tax=Nocardia sp. NPDC059240 TaxID=3346786 RepID=UPI0036954DE4
MSLLRFYPDLVEADLARFFGLRYSDRWRFDAHGYRMLTVREIWVRLRQLPDDARLVIHSLGRRRWSDESYLLADVFTALTGRAHPARSAPATTPAPADDEAARREQLRLNRIREKRIREGQEV